MDDIILCQPDSRKGCSLCCGLFNLADLSRENAGRFLSAGPLRVSELQDAPPDIPCLPQGEVRDITTYLCPFQGFLAPGRPGCLLHPAFIDRDLRDRSLYQKKICQEFLCPAHRILSREEKILLIHEVEDWFLYSVAVADPESCRWILRNIEECFPEVDGGTHGRLFQAALAVHAGYLARRAGPLFAYSLQEYHEISVRISPARADGKRERDDIMEALHAIVGADLTLS